MRVAATIYVVNLQKPYFRFAAARTNFSAICFKNQFFEPCSPFLRCLDSPLPFVRKTLYSLVLVSPIAWAALCMDSIERFNSVKFFDRLRFLTGRARPHRGIGVRYAIPTTHQPPSLTSWVRSVLVNSARDCSCPSIALACPRIRL